MRNQAVRLFVFSFTCFIGVFVFGSILGPLQKTYADPKVIRNLSLFHNHSDQLCWLGAAALGATLHVTRDAFRGSERVLRIFTLSYMAGTALFSSAFLVRALGLILSSSLLEERAYIGLVSLGGLLNIVAIISGVYVANAIVAGLPARHQDTRA